MMLLAPVLAPMLALMLAPMLAPMLALMLGGAAGTTAQARRVDWKRARACARACTLQASGRKGTERI